MTRKDFKLLAEYLSMVEPKDATWVKCVRNIAFACARTNMRFDTQRFIDACGLPQNDLGE